MEINEILEISPYSLSKDQKRELLNNRLHELTRKHYEQCLPYRRMMDAMELDMDNLPGYEKLPFLPVRLFKEFELRSCEKDEIVKTMTSSGTTGQQVSRIFLDRETSSAQQKCLTKIVSHFIGTKRVPMLILDTSAVVKNRSMFSARGAGILGFPCFTARFVFVRKYEKVLEIYFNDYHSSRSVWL